MRKWISLAVVVLAFGLMLGCGEDKKFEPKPSGATTEPFQPEHTFTMVSHLRKMRNNDHWEGVARREDGPMFGFMSFEIDGLIGTRVTLARNIKDNWLTVKQSHPEPGDGTVKIAVPSMVNPGLYMGGCVVIQPPRQVGDRFEVIVRPAPLSPFAEDDANIFFASVQDQDSIEVGDRVILSSDRIGALVVLE